MKGRRRDTILREQFVDALREVLGLGPLYAAEPGPDHKFAVWMLGRSKPGFTRSPSRTGVDR